MANGWGGARPGSGPKAKVNRPVAANGAVRKRRPEPTHAPVPAEPKRWMPSFEAVTEIIQASQNQARNRVRTAANSPFKLPDFHPSARPPGGGMAMDNALCAGNEWATGAWMAGSIFNAMDAEGLVFMGYPYLSELAQRPEYRTMSETIADDATRRWIDFEVTGDEQENKRRAENDPDGEAERMADPDERKKRVDASGKTDKVKALKDDQERLDVRDKFYCLCRDDGFFGRMHLYLNFGNDIDGDISELKTPIGNGRDEFSRSKGRKGSFESIKTVEPMWVYPQMYNAQNPLKADWYNPQQWFVLGREIHRTRLLPFISRPVPDMLKPAYAFGGLALSQIARPYVDIWLNTRQSVADLIKSFSVMVLMTDMATMLQPGGGSLDLMARVALFNTFRDNQGAFVINKATEDFKNVAAQLSGLDQLQAQAQEHMCSVSRIPLVKFTGISPHGLNASSEGEIQVYDDTIGAYQNRVMRGPVTTVVNFQQLSMFGEIDPEISVVFPTLRVMTEKERADLQKADADRHQVYVDMGAFSPEEVRKIAIDDPELPYAGLDPDDVPDLREEEEGGLVPEGAGKGLEAVLGGSGEESGDPEKKRAA